MADDTTKYTNELHRLREKLRLAVEAGNETLAASISHALDTHKARAPRRETPRLG
jgi:hypothetical protein